MSSYSYTCIYICIFTWIYICIYPYVDTCIFICARARTHALDTNTHVLVYIEAQILVQTDEKTSLCYSDQTATHCNALQHTATHCSTLQHTAAHCITLQHTATHCNTLLHTATNCNTLQHRMDEKTLSCSSDQTSTQTIHRIMTLLNTSCQVHSYLSMKFEWVMLISKCSVTRMDAFILRMRMRHTHMSHDTQNFVKETVNAQHESSYKNPTDTSS